MTGPEADRSAELTRTVDYLGRDELADNAKLQFYDGAHVGLDARALTSGWTDDKRHFRMIVSAEDGTALGDLKPFIREVMAGLETKLGTRLTWLAIDHHDTDNPHSHVLIRGRRPDGQDLFIPSRLISGGIRNHAQEIVTRVLGPRQGIDLVREHAREIGAKTATALDHDLMALRGADQSVLPDRPDLAARLERLEGWGLASRQGGSWRLHADLKGQLAQLEAYAQVEQAIAGRWSEGGQPLLAADPHAPFWGRLIHAGAADEFGDRFLAVIETGHGDLRYAHFERSDDLAVLSGAERGAIVTFHPAVASTRPSDEAVQRVARLSGGLYSADIHALREPHAPPGLIKANIRRLEAMRRANLISRRTDGVFEAGVHHLDRALLFEQRRIRRFPISVRVASYWTLEEQVASPGLTHLDRVLAQEARAPTGDGAFARQFGGALQQRRLFLIEKGWLGKGEHRLQPSELHKLADRELRAIAKQLSRELSIPVSPQSYGVVTGVYARRIDLAQGRVALIVQDTSAVVVPWRAPLERFAGSHVEGVMRGQTISWRLQRSPGIDLPPM